MPAWQPVARSQIKKATCHMPACLLGQAWSRRTPHYLNSSSTQRQQSPPSTVLPASRFPASRYHTHCCGRNRKEGTVFLNPRATRDAAAHAEYLPRKGKGEYSTKKQGRIWLAETAATVAAVAVIVK